MYMYTYLEMMVQTYKMMAHDSGVDFDFSCALFPLICGNHDLPLLFPAILFFTGNSTDVQNDGV